MRSRDTSHRAAELQRAAVGRMTGAERLRAALEMSDTMRALRLAGLRRTHPDWDERAIVRAYVEESTRSGGLVP